MKKLFSLFAILAIVTMTSSCVSTQNPSPQQGRQSQTNNAVSKGLFGAGAGAIVTLLLGGGKGDYLKNGAIGGAIGYILGNEQDKTNLRSATYQQPKRPQTRRYDKGYNTRPTSYKQPKRSTRRYDTGYNDNTYTEYPNETRYDTGAPETKCRKVVKIVTKNGKTEEEFEEICTSSKTEAYY